MQVKKKKKEKVAEIAVGRSFLLVIFFFFRPFAVSAVHGMSREVSFACCKMKIA